MSMNFRELAGYGQQHAPKFKAGFQVMAAMASSLEAQGLLPQRIEVPVVTTEALREIKRFTPEARQLLEERGFVIHELTGQSIKTLRDSGKSFWSTWHENNPKLEAMPSRSSEVAINPAQLLLPDSNRKTLEEQEQMVREFSKELTEETTIKDIEAVIGEMPDYIDLAFAHFDATGVRLFGEDYGYNYARTKTPTVGSVVAFVGVFRVDDGLYVDGWSRDDGRAYVFASPLVVPKQ